MDTNERQARLNIMPEHTDIDQIAGDRIADNQTVGDAEQTPGLFDSPIISIIAAILLAICFRSLAYEPFNIPSGSMKPTLLVGDYIFVSKYSYGYSRYSFPFGLSLFEDRIFDDTPKRGDVVVFKLPSDPAINYIKRLIGLPGDRIQVRDGIVYLNGKQATRRRIEPFKDHSSEGNVVEIPQFIETLPGGISYHVLDQYRDAPLDNTSVYRVPEGHYFMMGDNRDNSQDSRVLHKVGYIPHDHLVGPARVIFFSARDALWEFWTYRKERFIKSIGYE